MYLVLELKWKQWKWSKLLYCINLYLFTSVFFTNSFSWDLYQLAQNLNWSNINHRQFVYTFFSFFSRNIVCISAENRSSQVFSNLEKNDRVALFSDINMTETKSSKCFQIQFVDNLVYLVSKSISWQKIRNFSQLCNTVSTGYLRFEYMLQHKRRVISTNLFS